MCEELSTCAVMTDGAGSLFQREGIKSQIVRAGEGQEREWGSRVRESERERELDLIRQMIRAIS